MTFEELKATVEPYLQILGGFETAEEIREFFQREGIKARRRNSSKCIIAEYLHRETGESVVVGTVATCPSLGDHSSMFTAEDNFLGWHTRAMFNFLMNYDAGDYPELVG